jgi:hypothetical protein
VGYLERLVVLTAPERGAGIPLRGISGDPARLNGCDPTAAPDGIYAVAPLFHDCSPTAGNNDDGCPEEPSPGQSLEQQRF